MLRHAARLLLPRGGVLAQQAAACSSQCTSWTQIRSKSNVTSTGTEDGSFVNNSVDLSDLPASELVSQADALVSASQAAGEAAVLAAQGSCWAGTRTFIDLMMWTHDSLSMPWFEAIVASNLVIKLATLPLTIMTQREAPKMQAVRTEAEQLKKMSLEMNQAKTAAEYERALTKYKAAYDEFRARNKGSFFKSLALPGLSIAQAVLFISQFSAVSTLAQEKLPSMTYEGALWFTNLTLPDPFFGLPVLCSAATLAMLHHSSMRDTMMQMGDNAAMMKNVMTGVALIMIPAGAYASSAIALLWTSNALFSIAQNLVLGNNGVRRVLGMPVRPGGRGVQQQQQQQPWIRDASNWISQYLPSRRRAAASASASAAAGTAGAPPPGTKKVAVNYTQKRPRRKGQ